MPKDRRSHDRVAAFVAALVFPYALAAQQRIVTPNDGTWAPDLRGSNGTAQITGARPRNGNGSLELHTTGLFSDWGWFNLYAGDPLTSSWGQLADISYVAFDWMRGNDSYAPNSPVWQAQSVALRLFVRSGTGVNSVFSELVWERWYSNGLAVPRDVWITDDLTNQLFWRFVSGDGYTLPDCSNELAVPPGVPLKTATTSQWASGNNCYTAGDLTVYGIGVGVGSAWPFPFTGFADNVQLAFDDVLVVNDNFEVNAVPEAASLVLVGTGLGVLALVRRRRKKTA
jgi:hypothetical protein